MCGDECILAAWLQSKPNRGDMYVMLHHDAQLVTVRLSEDCCVSLWHQKEAHAFLEKLCFLRGTESRGLLDTMVCIKSPCLPFLLVPIDAG